MKNIYLNNRILGEGRPSFIIAEAGVNHDGKLEQALLLVEAAAEAGADAVKFQSFTAERLVTAQAPKAEYQKISAVPSESQLDMLKKLELSIEDHRQIVEHCHKFKIEFLSTPFDEEWCDVLDELGVPAFKVGSGELTNLPFLSHVAGKHKPIILSTGMSGVPDVELALSSIQAAGGSDVVLLQCTSSYPALPETVNLNAMQTMAKRFKRLTGFSDHTSGIEVAIGAAALGAIVIEKHFTLNRRLNGPDHSMSLEPAELAAMIYAIHNVEKALGNGQKLPSAKEMEVAKVARRSLVAAKDLDVGAMLDADAVAIRRPGTGLPPVRMPSILGLRTRCVIPKGTLLAMDMLETP